MEEILLYSEYSLPPSETDVEFPEDWHAEGFKTAIEYEAESANTCYNSSFSEYSLPPSEVSVEFVKDLQPQQLLTGKEATENIVTAINSETDVSESPDLSAVRTAVDYEDDTKSRTKSSLESEIHTAKSRVLENFSTTTATVAESEEHTGLSYSENADTAVENSDIQTCASNVTAIEKSSAINVSESIGISEKQMAASKAAENTAISKSESEIRTAKSRKLENFSTTTATVAESEEHTGLSISEKTDTAVENSNMQTFASKVTAIEKSSAINVSESIGISDKQISASKTAENTAISKSESIGCISTASGEVSTATSGLAGCFGPDTVHDLSTGYAKSDSGYEIPPSTKIISFDGIGDPMESSSEGRLTFTNYSSSTSSEASEEGARPLQSAFAELGGYQQSNVIANVCGTTEDNTKSTESDLDTAEELICFSEYSMPPSETAIEFPEYEPYENIEDIHMQSEIKPKFLDSLTIIGHEHGKALSPEKMAAEWQRITLKGYGNSEQSDEILETALSASWITAASEESSLIQGMSTSSQSSHDSIMESEYCYKCAQYHLKQKSPSGHCRSEYAMDMQSNADVPDISSKKAEEGELSVNEDLVSV